MVFVKSYMLLHVFVAVSCPSVCIYQLLVSMARLLALEQHMHSVKCEVTALRAESVTWLTGVEANVSGMHLNLQPMKRDLSSTYETLWHMSAKLAMLERRLQVKVSGGFYFFLSLMNYLAVFHFV